MNQNFNKIVFFMLIILMFSTKAQCADNQKTIDSLKNVINNDYSEKLSMNARNELAKVLFSKGDSSWINYLNDNIKTFSGDEEQSKIIAETYYVLFKIEMNKDRKKSLEYADTVCKYMSDKKIYFDLLVAKGRILFDTGNRKQGIKSLLDVIKLAKETHVDYQLGIARGELASMYVMSSRIEEAFDQIDSAIVYFYRVDDYENLGIFNSLKAGCYAKLSQYYKSNTEYIKSINYLESKGVSKSNMINNYFNIAVNYDSVKEYTKAEKYFKEVMAIAVEDSNTTYLALANCGLGITYRESKRFKESEVLLRKSLELAKEIGYSYLTLESELALGELYIELDEFKQAKVLLDKSLPIIIKSQDNINLLEIYVAYSKYYYGVGEYKEAINFANKAIELGDTVSENGEILKAYLYLSLSNEALKNYKNALLASKLYEQYKDSVFVTEKNNAMARIEIQFETAKKEQQIKILQLEDEKNQVTITKTKQINYAMMLGMALFLLILIPSSLFFRQKQKSKLLLERIAAEEAESSRIAKELHDGIASQLSYVHSFICKQGEDNELAQVIKNARNEVRAISHKLNIGTLTKLSFKEALYDGLNLAHWNPDVDVKIALKPNSIDIADENIKRNTIRIIQELMANSLKHSQASEVSLKLIQENDHINLSFQDNGIGFDMSKVIKGHGFQNIDDRVKSISGKIEYQSAPNQGVKVDVMI